MHFGRVPPNQMIPSILPPDTIRTQRFLALQREGETNIHIGCPIWAWKPWVGTLYPPKTKPAQYLAEYAKHFSTVEVNSTFYHLLDASRIEQWRQQVGPSFRFCPKVYRGITEQLDAPQLKDLIAQYVNAITAFGETLGLVFAQLPESIGPQHAGLVKRFIEHWPQDVALALEFRHRGWFQQHSLRDDVVNHLYRHRIATVITDTPGRRDVLHFSLTQPRVMIRFQGNETPSSDCARLSHWAERLKQWAIHRLEGIYFFVHQPNETMIPDNARFMLAAYKKTRDSEA